jgi:hypothetical protein
MIEEDQVVEWLCSEATDLLEDSAGMGAIEKLVDRVCLEARRRAVERLVQQVAAAVPLACPRCGKPVRVEEHGRPRRVNSSTGLIRFRRTYAFCAGCQQYTYPADAALGLHERAAASPRVQEICALTALRAPATQVQEDARRLSGVDLDPSSLHREARRQGQRALALREADVALSRSTQGLVQLAARATCPPAPFTLVIEMDAWNIRERDHWGLTEQMRAAAEDTGRWHWVYTATVFRLDQRSRSESGRPFIAERGYVATRAGLDAFREQLYTEAIQRGLLQAAQVLILGDGAIWIWNLAQDRFASATQRVDLYHVKEHLWSLARELHGEGTAQAREWVAPYLRWLEQRRDGALDVLQGLEGLRANLAAFHVEQQQALDREIGYFNTHKERMDYKAAQVLGQPVGSGAIESTCNQYQRRFKLPGQFWSLEGDEAFLALSTLHRNQRWHTLFPHDSG